MPARQRQPVSLIPGPQPTPVTGGTSPPPPARRPVAGPRPYRHPLLALPATILLGLLAAFFAWQAAEPLWLALGRGTDGTATEARCDATDGSAVELLRESDGPTYRCLVFTASDRSFENVDVELRGAGSVARPEGASTPARMLSPDSTRAYATAPAALHLRWSIGLALVLACGAGVAWASGATRLDLLRDRRRAVALSVAGPLVLAAGFLVAAY